MPKKICKGDSVFIPFRNGESVSDSQLKPRMYMSRESFVNHFPGHYLGTKDVELVEYTPVVHGWWKRRKNWMRSVCSACSFENDEETRYCPNCGARKDCEKHGQV